MAGRSGGRRAISPRRGRGRHAPEGGPTDRGTHPGAAPPGPPGVV